MSQGAADSASFLEARLARCRAIPEHQRPPEVAAFVLCADLQAQAAMALAARPARSLERRRQQSLLFSLRLTASHCNKIEETALLYCENLLLAATDQLDALLAARLGGAATVGSIGRQLAALLEQDRSLTTLLAVSAALLNIKDVEHNADLLFTGNAVVRRMGQPSEAAQLRQELAAAQAQLPVPLLSYEQLLALFVGFARQRAMEVLGSPQPAGAASLALAVQEAVQEALRAAVELQPRLMPPHHSYQFFAAMCACLLEGCDPRLELRLVREVLAAAEQRGADFTVAMCAYDLPLAAHRWAHRGQPAGLQEDCTPSDALGWLRHGKAAQRRCEALLPQQWTCGLARRYKTAKELKPWLKQLQQEGDRWRPMDAGGQQAFGNACTGVMPQLLHRPAAALECSGCGEFATHLKRCGACRLSQYCSSKCQRTHWPQHRDACKAEQRRQEQQRRE